MAKIKIDKIMKRLLSQLDDLETEIEKRYEEKRKNLAILFQQILTNKINLQKNV